MPAKHTDNDDSDDVDDSDDDDDDDDNGDYDEVCVGGDVDQSTAFGELYGAPIILALIKLMRGVVSRYLDCHPKKVFRFFPENNFILTYKT